MTRKHEQQLKELFQQLGNYITAKEKTQRKNEYNNFIQYLYEGYPKVIVDSTIFDITHRKM